MSNKIRIKLVSKYPKAFKLLAEPEFSHDDIEWILDWDARDYDWFVVCDDLPGHDGERFSLRVEELACPKARQYY